MCASLATSIPHMSIIIDFLRKINIFPSKDLRIKPMLGRWCILNKEYNNRKIDMANIDHCGSCHYDYKKVDPKKDSTSSPVVHYNNLESPFIK